MADPLRPLTEDEKFLRSLDTAQDFTPKDVSRLDRAELNRKRQRLLQNIVESSRDGVLPEDLVGTTREAAADLGISQSELEQTARREGIGLGAPIEQAPEASPIDRQRAAQNVLFQRRFGSGLATLDAMQDDNYEIGTGGALRQAPRQIGTKSGAMRREARRLRKQGYTAQAGQLAGAAARQKLLEGGAIMTEGRRGMEAAQQIQTGEMAMAQQDLTRKQIGYANKLLSRRSDALDSGVGEAPVGGGVMTDIRQTPRDIRYRFSSRYNLLGGSSPYMKESTRFFDFD